MKLIMCRGDSILNVRIFIIQEKTIILKFPMKPENPPHRPYREPFNKGRIYKFFMI